MKKIILASLVASALLAESTYDITPMIGYVHTKDHVDIENHAVAGIAASRNMDENSMFNSFELGLLQSEDADYVKSSKDTQITQLYFNGVKDYKFNDSFKLYALSGFGFERLSSQEFGNESDPFFNYGVGTAYTFANDIALKLDVRHQLKFDGDKNIVTILGLSIPIGAKTQKAAPVSASPKDDDKDGVINSLDKCPNSPLGATVNEHGCEMDDDKDGVVNSLDKCLTTDLGATVDAKGCEVLVTPVDLGINFDTNSAKINSNEIVKFDKYVTYLNNLPETKIILEAHTDSVGSENYNLALSKKRAASAKKQLVSMGIESDRINSIGYGETKPMVSNDTAENRAKNRRVTARIAK